MPPGRREAAVATALAGWFVATVLCQHPRREAERLRSLLPAGLIPDWRLFAPDPVRHDLVLVHRTVSATGVESPWRVTTPIGDRAWRHLVWFPRRRMEKALHDVAAELLAEAARGGGWTGHHTFLLLRDHALRAARPDGAVGLQFGVLRTPGDALLLVSPFVPCLEEVAR